MKQKRHKRLAPPQARKQHKKKQAPRKEIISFRLRDSEVKALITELNRHPTTMVRSPKQLSRKIVIDFLANRLVYPVAAHRQTGHEVAEAPNCDIRDPHFLQSLHRFIGEEDNWKKLRCFILGQGWPELQGKQFRETLDDHERLTLARQVIGKLLKRL